MDTSRRFGPNPFEIGLFSFNVDGGMAQTKVPFWDASWDNNVTVARLAEEAGLDFLLPLGRWHGTGDWRDETETEGRAFETLTWASGLLAKTERIAIFGTLHVAYVNPVFTAKQVVTAHHIGHGRFGLNVVSGSSASDNAMMGVPFGTHDTRYEYLDEWLTVAKRVWTETEPFDHTGPHFTLRGVFSKPKPYGGIPPKIISAGHSHLGRAFAMRHANALFTSITEIENAAMEIAGARASTADGASVPIYASGHLICKPTQQEAEDYYRYLVYECGAWQTVEATVEARLQNRVIPYASMQKLKERIISGGGTLLVLGGYDEVAETFRRLHADGLDGMALNLIDYIGDFPALRDEVLPRLERLGLRVPAMTAASRSR
jgi:alkanesulfonate monooxygenase SsuD/methylene tetrahydromethanopterin reductase-like flavin-dependent oxidoreductase (luciferase family)